MGIYTLKPNNTAPINTYNGDIKSIPTNSKVSGSYHGENLNGDV